MKIYEVVTMEIRENGEPGDEWQAYFGANYEEAKKALEKEKSNFTNYLTAAEKAHTRVEGRFYKIDDSVDLSDKDEIENAVIDCIGYDTFDVE
jgi:predicted nuclease with TOPRIM domain